MKTRHLDEIKGVIIFSIGLLFLVSLISYDPLDIPQLTRPANLPIKNFAGIVGAYIAFCLNFLFGKVASFLIPALVFLIGIKQFRSHNLSFNIVRVLGLFGIICTVSILVSISTLHVDTTRFKLGGIIGHAAGNFFLAYFKPIGSYLILVTLGLLFFVLVAELLVSNLFNILLEKFKAIYLFLFSFMTPKDSKQIKVKPANGSRISLAKPKPKIAEGKSQLDKSASVAPIGIKELLPKPAKPKIFIDKPQEGQKEMKRIPDIIIGDYHLPNLDLLEMPPPLEERKIKEDLEANANILEDTLNDFGISVKVTNIEQGPVITRYELEPAPGVKLQKITSLSDDISLSLKAQSVRIVAPIPGKGTVGVEVPNIQSSVVYLREVLSGEDFQKSDSKLALALGKDISGHPVVADLDEMPHLLIAGTTGSGKTVCVNSLILSLLFKCTPQELKFIMVDPKMVELAPFNGLPHLICPVVTNAKKVSGALTWLVNEMEQRYSLLAKSGSRNIQAYNAKEERNMPFIVVIIDELADLMAVAANHIENAITRLAQLSRAVGIHLILATQRPSVDVITGVIKANFPARISFKVASKVDSRTVLDMNGADKLLGRGDLLFLKPGESKLIRAQGSYLKDKEIQNVVDFIKAQAQPVYEESILDEKKGSFNAPSEKDELFDEAVRVIVESNQASVSILQRRMRLGYTRAARLIDSMEQEGIIGPFEGSKPRKILVDREAWLQKSLKEEQGLEVQQ